MKLVHMASGLAVAIALAACADKSADIQTPAPAANTSISATQQPAIQQPNVSGTVWIRQKVALPPDAVLTVTLSDASLADAPSKVLAQKAVRTEGKQSPFSFVLSFNPADVQPNARILLSAAITVNDKLVFITDTVQPVINQGGTKADLTGSSDNAPARWFSTLSMGALLVLPQRYSVYQVRSGRKQPRQMTRVPGCSWQGPHPFLPPTV